MAKKRKQKPPTPRISVDLSWSVATFIARALELECRDQPTDLSRASHAQITDKLAGKSHGDTVTIVGSQSGFYGILSILTKRKSFPEAIKLNQELVRAMGCTGSVERDRALKESRQLVEKDIKNESD